MATEAPDKSQASALDAKSLQLHEESLIWHHIIGLFQVGLKTRRSTKSKNVDDRGLGLGDGLGASWGLPITGHLCHYFWAEMSGCFCWVVDLIHQDGTNNLEGGTHKRDPLIIMKWPTIRTDVGYAAGWDVSFCPICARHVPFRAPFVPELGNLGDLLLCHLIPYKTATSMREPPSTMTR